MIANEDPQQGLYEADDLDDEIVRKIWLRYRELDCNHDGLLDFGEMKARCLSESHTMWGRQSDYSTWADRRFATPWDANRNSPSSCETWLNSPRVWLTLGQVWSTSGTHRSLRHGRVRANDGPKSAESTRLWSKTVECGRNLATFGGPRPELDRLRANFGEPRGTLGHATFGRTLKPRSVYVVQA